MVLVDEVAGGVEGGQHAETQQVDLDESGGGDVVLVALKDAAALGGRPLHGHDLADGLPGEDHAARVHPEVPREGVELGGEVAHVAGEAGVGAGRGVVDVPGHLPGLRFRVAEDPGGVADREPRPIGDHVGYLGGVQAAVTGVDVLDDLLAAPGLQVEVDVRRARLLQGQEPFEEQAVPERVDGGDAEDVADHAAGGRAPALAPDPLFGGVPDDVVDDQEVAREPEPGDQVEFVVELPPGRSRPGSTRGP